MQYQRLTDESSLILTENGESLLVSSSLNTNRNVCRVRNYLLILLLIQSILSAVLLLIVACLLSRNNVDDYSQGMRSLGPILLSLIYYGCGSIAVYRYYHLGIYVFAWFGFLQYLSLCAEVFLNTVFIVRHPAHDKETKIGFHIALMITILSLSQVILTVITMKFAFKLLRLIKSFQRDVIEQM